MLSSTVHKTVGYLLEGQQYRIVRGLSGMSLDEVSVATVTSDSRQVTPESLFIALSGTANDGHNYIEAAVEAGCRAVICNAGMVSVQLAQSLHAAVIEVEDTAEVYAAVAANFFDRPAEKLRLIGVTGTNGKTTTTYLLEHVLLQAGLAVGVVGTVNNRYTGKNGEQKILKTRFTTPEAFSLQELLREMADSGVEYVIMEVSSHALAQSRIGSLLFEVTAFTNLSRDHLDYHVDMDDYFGAKMLLFSKYLKIGGIAVLPMISELAEDKARLSLLELVTKKICRRTIFWGEEEGADICLLNYATKLDQTDVQVKTPSGLHNLCSPLVGRYNIDNILTVYGLCMALNINEKSICEALSSAAGAPGRVERVATGTQWDSKGPVVLVDYAHTPDALEKMLLTLVDLPHGKLFCVFGCGGDRDTGKRALMGEIAGKICDVVVVTDDNPRTENPDKIITQILAGLERTPLKLLQTKKDYQLKGDNSKDCGYVVIRDRAKAIETAIRAASPGDIVVIAGKGHEPYQLTLQGKRFFDDCQEAKRVLFSWTTNLVVAAVDGKLHGEKRPSGFLGPVLTDSRTVSQEGIFVALRGENHDGHDFVKQVIENGATCLVVEKVVDLPAGLDVCQIVVKDTQRALGDLAGFRRRALAARYDQKIIGLTGSCGKTTVKEMVGAILERMWPEGADFPAGSVLKTKGNFNNLIGLPLSLLPLDVHHRAAVLEMGMNRPGELQRLGEIADPDISCITNIHGAHLEGLGSIEGVARAKEELFDATKESGVLVVNLDDRWVRDLSRKYTNRKITFSVQVPRKGQKLVEKVACKPDIWASDIFMEEGGLTTFTMHHAQEMAEINLYIVGEHNVSNALCAAAIAVAAGASLEIIAVGLSAFRPPDKRMELFVAKSGFTIINDTYNANPASMAAGLKTLKKISKKTSVAIIGDMRELGDYSHKAHFDIGKLIADLAIDCVGVVGVFKQDVVQGALENGFSKDRLQIFSDKEDAIRWVEEMVTLKKIGEGDVLLVKASRGLRFETIVAELMEM